MPAFVVTTSASKIGKIEVSHLYFGDRGESRKTVYRGFNGGTNYSLESMQAQSTNTNR